MPTDNGKDFFIYNFYKRTGTVEEHFKAEITIDLLKDFVIELATNVCKDYENKKQFSKEKIK